MPPRPTCVTVLSIIGIVLASLGTCLLLFSVVPQRLDPAVQELTNTPFYKAFMLVGGIVSVAVVIMLWFGSIGSLNMSPAARKTLIVYSWCGIVWQVIGLVVTLAYIGPNLMAPILASRRGTLPPGYETGYWAGFYVGAVLGFLVMVTYPILVLVYFNTVKVKNAFSGVYDVSTRSFPVQQQQPEEQEYELRQ